MPKLKRKSISWQVKDQVWDKTRNRCWYCGINLGHEDYGTSNFRRRPNIEHQIPLSDGGTNELENLVLCCYGCNADKRCRPVEEYRRHNTEMVATYCDDAIDFLVEIEWWNDNEREHEAIRRLIEIRNFYRSLRVSFFGEQARGEWSDYTI